ncbi:DNA-binding transcriptional regulator, Lrp family [Bosea sp. OK403]|uniref:Lrp/AsnC family transcriptional regulator n=1 Tax=Bosea sp. OK403 TaxID=1855286 RepID=UPI0008E381D7|nr:Lrp/AsnC family transcriptional regulator [Bosea sp. OK403]SFJ52313.1 DNA-binding transcriptional regulator, Lrp family [Bosea sp. OK403]
MAKIELSAQDSKLLQILQSDARVSNQDLADQAGMSASACWRRVRMLEEAGVIASYMAIVDAERAGFGFSAIVHVTLLRHEADHVSNFIARVAQQPEVVECFATTGEADYHLRVVCRDKDDYNVFLEQFLFRLPGIAHVRTNLVLKEIKLHGKIPA